MDLVGVEAALHQCPEVRRAYVTARERGSGDSRLVAHVELDDGYLPHTTLLRDRLRELLPPGLLPASFVFVDSMPLTPAGDVDVSALPDADPASDRPTPHAAKTALEQSLCDLFAEVLGVGSVGIDDNFFEFGGDSFTATRLIRRIREETGLPLTAEVFFAGPSVAELSHALSDPSANAREIVELWKAALHNDDITVDDDFFDLGGNSIIAVRLIPLLKAAFDVEPHVSVIFDHPTPRELADALRALAANRGS
jgi:acyl carrier protein